MKNLLKFADYIKEELGPKFAAASLDPNSFNDERTVRLKKDAITSLFSDYIGKDLQFYCKTLDSNDAIKYKLIKVVYSSMRKELELYFYNENGILTNAPFANNKKEIVLIYSLKEDKYINDGMTFLYNQYTINFLIKAASLIRNTYYTRFPEYKPYDSKFPSKSVIDVEATEELKKTRLTKQRFRIFSFDSKNLLNK